VSLWSRAYYARTTQPACKALGHRTRWAIFRASLVAWGRMRRRRRAMWASGRGTSARTPPGGDTVARMAPNARTAVADRVVERRRAVALARHYREAEGLSIVQIATASVARRRPSRRTSTTHLMLTKDLRAARRSDSSGRSWSWRTSICKRLLGSRCDGTRPASRLPDLSGYGSLERRYSGPRYCP